MHFSDLDSDTREINPLSISLENKKLRPSKKPTKLVIGLKLEFSDGTSIPLSALIDTGAEVNLVNSKLIPQKFFSPAKKPVKLGAANSTRLIGGTKEIFSTLNFAALEVVNKQKLDLRIPFQAYDAHIKHDCIISFSWLVDNAAYLNFQRLGLYFKNKKELIWVQGLPPATENTVILSL